MEKVSIIIPVYNRVEVKEARNATDTLKMLHTIL